METMRIKAGGLPTPPPPPPPLLLLPLSSVRAVKIGVVVALACCEWTAEWGCKASGRDSGDCCTLLLLPGALSCNTPSKTGAEPLLRRLMLREIGGERLGPTLTLWAWAWAVLFELRRELAADALCRLAVG